MLSWFRNDLPLLREFTFGDVIKSKEELNNFRPLIAEKLLSLLK